MSLEFVCFTILYLLRAQCRVGEYFLRGQGSDVIYDSCDILLALRHLYAPPITVYALAPHDINVFDIFLPKKKILFNDGAI